MPLSRRAVLGVGVAAALSGCAGPPDPLPADAQRLSDAVDDAYDEAGEMVAEPVGFNAEDLGGDLGWAVVADFRIADGGASVETLQTRFNATTILVFEHLYATEIRMTEPTVRGFVLWDDPQDLSEEPKQQQVARATISRETAQALDFRTLDPGDLPAAADGYAFEERYVREPTTRPG